MKIELLINNMTCNHCVRRVQNALEEAYPNTAVNVDLSKKIATLDGTGPFEESQLKTIIDDAGYDLVKMFVR
ncbi:MAG: heavy-metal-associated domain-containing protein [Erysipelothrix sp.]|jgi:copper chaperone|nr:heavy-metal-associated domain-containing protein [Erysipelothrix sp.]